jgi:L,D-transpeptidase ErfK/SrfK
MNDNRGIFSLPSVVKSSFVLLVTAFCLLSAGTAKAGVYSISDGETVIGSVLHYSVKPGESLIEIARKFGLGYQEVAEANPGVDPFVPDTGRTVTLPTSWILPRTDLKNGILINLSELRLYYFFTLKGVHYVRMFPIGIGREGFNTPTGDFTIIEKIVKPAWHVPESIRKEKPELPEVVPPGPDNPLGSHAMRLSLGDVLIHGTNRPWGVGRRVSHGCIRLYPEDIPKLFAQVSQGTHVNIVKQPVKVGMKNGKVFIEVHGDGDQENLFDKSVALLRSQGLLRYIRTEKLYYALSESHGLPVDITD